MKDETSFRRDVIFKNGPLFIINADDLGICSERDKGIFELFEKGYISSASILVNCINFENSILISRRMNLQLGLHLNLTEGEPIFRENISSNTLVFYNSDKNTYQFHGKFKFREKMEKNEINHSDIKEEIRQQV